MDFTNHTLFSFIVETTKLQFLDSVGSYVLFFCCFWSPKTLKYTEWRQLFFGVVIFSVSVRADFFGNPIWHLAAAVLFWSHIRTNTLFFSVLSLVALSFSQHLTEFIYVFFLEFKATATAASQFCCVILFFDISPSSSLFSIVYVNHFVYLPWWGRL